MRFITLASLLEEFMSPAAFDAHAKRLWAELM